MALTTRLGAVLLAVKEFNRRINIPTLPSRNCFSLSALGIALLAFTHRSIHASRAHISTNRAPKKPFPATVKTLGDQIRVKRVEMRVSLKQLAKIMGVRVTKTRDWESDKAKPSPDELALLGQILDLPTQSNPTVE